MEGESELISADYFLSSLIPSRVNRLVPPLSRAKLSRLCGRISLEYRTVGYHRTPAWPSESARRLAAVTILPSQAHTLRGRRVGLEQAQLQYRDPTLGRPLHYQALRETYTPLCPRTRRLVPSRHYRLLNLHPRYHREMAGSIRRIRRARWSPSLDVATPTIGTRLVPLRLPPLAQLEPHRLLRGLLRRPRRAPRVLVLLAPQPRRRQLFELGWSCVGDSKSIP
jgi:hypothetical protein